MIHGCGCSQQVWLVSYTGSERKVVIMILIMKIYGRPHAISPMSHFQYLRK